MKYFRNVYVKGYDKFPYTKLSGSKVLYYTGKLIYYKGTLPKECVVGTDFVFDCDCEFSEWKKLNKIFNKK